MTEKTKYAPRLLIVDCCSHIVDTLSSKLGTDKPSVVSGSNIDTIDEAHVDLIVVGTSNLPVRRLFLSRLRRFFPDPPILVLRKEPQSIETDEEILRGEFLLSDHRDQCDLAIVRSTREALPIPPCEHTQTNSTFELVRDVTRILADNFSDSALDLDQVAEELSVSPTKLSRVLNRDVHISFRQMLRQVRIEEAKRLLATSKLSIKEVAARVGFSDSHYFSRIFKQMTGSSPSEFASGPHELAFN